LSLAEVGRFAGAAQYGAEAIKLAEPTHHAFTIGIAYHAAGVLHLFTGDTAKACSLIEHGLAVIRAGNPVILLPRMVACSAWVLAQLGEGNEGLAEPASGR
jgi:hypothetical protein